MNESKFFPLDCDDLEGWHGQGRREDQEGRDIHIIDYPCWLSGKESACNAGDLDLILGWERSSGEGNSNTFQYSCLGNPMDRGASWAIVHGDTKESNTT